jgi:hypothetical protein
MMAEGVLINAKKFSRFPHGEASEALLSVRWEGILRMFTQPTTKPLGHDFKSLGGPYPVHRCPQVFIVLQSLTDIVDKSRPNR